MALNFSGVVVKGLGEGKKLGFPTLNLDANIAPKGLSQGVFAVRVDTGKKGEFLGVMHFGPRPTLGREFSLEIHCIGFEGNLYAKEVNVTVLRRIRGIEKFKDAGELKKVIKRDIAFARKA